MCLGTANKFWVIIVLGKYHKNYFDHHGEVLQGTNCCFKQRSTAASWQQSLFGFKAWPWPWQLYHTNAWPLSPPPTSSSPSSPPSSSSSTQLLIMSLLSICNTSLTSLVFRDQFLMQTWWNDKSLKIRTQEAHYDPKAKLSKHSKCIPECVASKPANPNSGCSSEPWSLVGETRFVVG